MQSKLAKKSICVASLPSENNSPVDKGKYAVRCNNSHRKRGQGFTAIRVEYTHVHVLAKVFKLDAATDVETLAIDIS